MHKILRNYLENFYNRNPHLFIGNHITKESIFRRLSSKIRMSPNFIIIGSIASGTTSLYNYLIQHPNILKSFRKEIYFFDLNYNRGFSWYRSFFPIQLSNSNFLTCEATATYLRHPLVPERIQKHLPKTKFIVLLRNPIDRAYGFYQSRVNHGDENLSFEDAIKEEENRLSDEIEKILNDQNYFPSNFYNFGYLSGGIYYKQLQHWFKIFPKEQFLILQSEKLFKNPEETLLEITDFLKISSFTLEKYVQFNVHKYEPLKKSTRDELSKYFQPYNNKLNKLLDKNFEWN